MSRRPAYAPTSHYWDGEQSAYNAGLSYFPDSPMIQPTPMGLAPLVLALAPQAGNLASSVVQKWFGGNAIDQQRQERVNYVAQKAVNNNEAAMRLINGAPPNVSGNERDMWTTARDLVIRANPSMGDVDIGADWLVNSGDTATNYPKMRAYIAAWDGAHPIQAATGAVSGAVGGFVSDFFNPDPIAPGPMFDGNGQPVAAVPRSAGVSPMLLLGIAAAAAFALSRRRR